ncbi:hypothetical protein Tco_1517776 [Tanacetum coccineum]
MERKEITYTVDMFRSTLQLPVETLDNPFIAPTTLEYIQPFMKIVSYQGEVDKNYALSWKSCQGDSLNLPDHRYSIYTIKRGTSGTNIGVAARFQQSQIHYHVLILKLQKSFIKLKCNKNVIIRKAQVHVKFSNSGNHELPHHQRSSKSNQESSSEEIVNQRNI